MLGFPTDFEGIDNENRLDRQSRQCWEFWRENSRTELISWLLTHHDIRNKTDKKIFVYSTRVVKRCMLLSLKTPTSGVMTLFWTIKRQNSWQITRSSCILKPLRNYHFFSKITYLVLSLCFSRFYSLIHFNVAGSDLNRDQANLERKYFLFDLKFNLLSFSVFENDLPT